MTVRNQPKATPDDCVELLRVWLADNKTVVDINPQPLADDPVAIGIVLADLARHVGNMTGDPVGCTNAIRALFNAELDAPTSPLYGELKKVP